jgi:glycine dehydrogenase subunit 1
LDYLPHTPEDIQKALRAIGVETLDDLFADIPPSLSRTEFDLPQGMDEDSLVRHIRSLADQNKTDQPCFLGAGVQRHFLPSVTQQLAMQPEFLTAYTPYQPEVSQGLLQATFEYQTMMSELAGLPISNASMYDGATATAEAALLAARATKRSSVLVGRGVHPETLEVLRTYLTPLKIDIEVLELDGLVSSTALIHEKVACFIVQSPNFLGYLERVEELAQTAHDVGALYIAVTDPVSLGLLKPPGSLGVDIVTGDGQTLGNPTNFGGPSFGFLVVAEALVRQMPGRVVGQTLDSEGRRGFVLTLQAREQHIRRSKAKSNICSNHQLTALMAAINLATLGPNGLREIAEQSVLAAHDLADGLNALGVTVHREPHFFNEFVIETQTPSADLRKKLSDHGISGGIPVPDQYGLSNASILAATEMTTPEDIAALLEALGEIENAT